MAASYSVRDLDLIPSLDFAFVDEFIKSVKDSSGQKSISKGFKYFNEGYIHELQVQSILDDTESSVTGKCYRSQKRNEVPHQLKVCLTRQGHLKVTAANCTCPFGLTGACGHITGMLYQLAQYKKLGLKAIPEDVAKTSQPQTWHVPRGDKIRGKAVNDIDVRGYSDVTEGDGNKKAIRSTLYNPLRGDPIDWPSKYPKLAESCPDSLMLLAIQSRTPQVLSKFGPIPQGSILSYQQPLESDCHINIFDGVGFPDLPVSNMMNNAFSTVLTKSQAVTLADLQLTQTEVKKFEKETRLQSENPLWHKLRKNRITASKVGDIYKRRKDFDTLTNRLKSTRRVTTHAMRQGLASEPTAARSYAEQLENGVNLYASGIVVSPWAPWIAASPDRKVYNPSMFPVFGLLEIKCPQVNSVLETQYLKKGLDELLRLNRNNKYYYQVMTQLAVTGLQWCDFFVWCQNDTHRETIYFNEEIWNSMKAKIDLFFFSSFI